ncbi:MAG: hypothetical protein LGR52_14520 [Candidatus Thiosymbion ectosymbiont of Robbea hypermnestra]|nr:hypothetical protein [Candidatus Thiosymbion ectosymbiont of Robbea hypermnestra]
MTIDSDRESTAEERAEISKRKREMELQRRIKKEETLRDLKRELGIPEKGKEK